MGSSPLQPGCWRAPPPAAPSGMDIRIELGSGWLPASHTGSQRTCHTHETVHLPRGCGGAGGPLGTSGLSAEQQASALTDQKLRASPPCKGGVSWEGLAVCHPDCASTIQGPRDMVGGQEWPCPLMSAGQEDTGKKTQKSGNSRQKGSHGVGAEEVVAVGCFSAGIQWLAPAQAPRGPRHTHHCSNSLGPPSFVPSQPGNHRGWGAFSGPQFWGHGYPPPVLAHRGAHGLSVPQQHSALREEGELGAAGVQVPGCVPGCMQGPAPLSMTSLSTALVRATPSRASQETNGYIQAFP